MKEIVDEVLYMKKLALLLCLCFLLSGCARLQSMVGGSSDQSDPPQSGDETPAKLEAPAAGTYLDATGAYTGMNDPAFWIARCADPGKVLMTAEQAAAFSLEITRTEGCDCVDLSAYPDALSAADLQKALDTYGSAPEGTLYAGAKPVSTGFQTEIDRLRNEAAVQESNPVRWAFVTENTQLRTFPTAQPLYLSAGDTEFDQCCETVLKLWEPVAVLHTSADGNWLLVQSYNYLGWLPADRAAFCDRTAWQGMFSGDFLVVTGSLVALPGDTTGAALPILFMGSRLPLTSTDRVDNSTALTCYTALLPGRDGSGNLRTRTVRVPLAADVHQGYLPYTEENLLNQLFKQLGRRYGWGGMFDGVDCSSLPCDAYQCFGLFLPRNSSRQFNIPGVRYDVSNQTTEEKTALLETLPIGSLLQLSGHMTVYLGMYEGVPYILHAAYRFAPPTGGDAAVCNSVVVSSVLVGRARGGTMLSNYLHFATVRLP